MPPYVKFYPEPNFSTLRRDGVAQPPGQGRPGPPSGRRGLAARREAVLPSGSGARHDGQAKETTLSKGQI